MDSDVIDVDVDRGVALIRGTVDDFSKLPVAAERAFGGGARATRIQLQAVRQAARANGPPAPAPSGLP